MHSVSSIKFAVSEKKILLIHFPIRFYNKLFLRCQQPWISLHIIGPCRHVKFYIGFQGSILDHLRKIPAKFHWFQRRRLFKHFPHMSSRGGHLRCHTGFKISNLVVDQIKKNFNNVWLHVKCQLRPKI